MILQKGEIVNHYNRGLYEVVATEMRTVMFRETIFDKPIERVEQFGLLRQQNERLRASEPDTWVPAFECKEATLSTGRQHHDPHRRPLEAGGAP